ncbi:hypothetical protein EDD85DRAFT_793618 [Armillaria nabsnona]|nr:hypothetical protein EDD85DRAFT_793618 [Armillaria nabsnona]
MPADECIDPSYLIPCLSSPRPRVGGVQFPRYDCFLFCYISKPDSVLKNSIWYQSSLSWNATPIAFSDLLFMLKIKANVGEYCIPQSSAFADLVDKNQPAKCWIS